MRKTVAMAILAGLAVILFFYMNNKIENPTETTTQFQKIMEYDLEHKYPISPYEVMAINHEIVQYLYGHKIQEHEIESVVAKQRKLFDKELLDLNPFEVQVEKVKKEVAEYQEVGFKIIKIDQVPIEYSPHNAKIASMKVIQYTNTIENNYLEYYLRKQTDDTWKIFGWQPIDQFSVPEVKQ